MPKSIIILCASAFLRAQFYAKGAEPKRIKGLGFQIKHSTTYFL